MKKMLRTLLTTFTLLSRIPVPVAFEPRYRGFLFAMPVVGLFAALPAAGLLLLSRFFAVPTFIAAGLTLFVSYAGFNLFHFDGLLDSADAFFLRADSERRHRILKDSAVGSFALFAGVLYLLLKFFALAIIFESHIPLAAGMVLVLFYPLSGRCAAGLLPLALGPAREEGLGRLMGEAGRFEGALGLLVYGGVALCIWGSFASDQLIPGGLILIISCLGAWGWASLLYRKIGGYTGDAFGLAVELGELFYLIGLAWLFSL